MNKIGLGQLLKTQKLHQGMPEERLNKLQESVIGQDGIFLSYQSDFFDIVYQIEKFSKRTKEIMDRTRIPKIEEEVKFKERIPSKYIYKMIAWFREVDKNSGAEATMQVFYDETGEVELPKDLAGKYGGAFKRDGNFIFIVPEQLVSGGNVVFSGDKAVRNNLDTSLYDWAMGTLEPVLNMHSHNSMDAFWSGEDDANELPLYTRLCLVVGRVNTDKPMYKLSWNFEGKRHNQKADVDSIFEPLEIEMSVNNIGFNQTRELNFDEGLEFIGFDEVSFDERWDDRLTERKVSVNKKESTIPMGSRHNLERLLDDTEDFEIQDNDLDFDHLGEFSMNQDLLGNNGGVWQDVERESPEDFDHLEDYSDHLDSRDLSTRLDKFNKGVLSSEYLKKKREIKGSKNKDNKNKKGRFRRKGK